MKIIQEYVDKIADELAGAKDYAEKYVYNKAKGESNRASQFKAMAQTELEHAMIIHQMAVGEIEAINTAFVPPDEMKKAWEDAHTHYVEQSAWIKQMLTM